jgi:uncharacterized membrane protein
MRRSQVRSSSIMSTPEATAAGTPVTSGSPVATGTPVTTREPAASSADDQHRDHPVVTPRQLRAIFAGLMMGMFLGALDQTIVSTSIRTIADDLGGLSLQAWATTAYLITSTITTPLYGKLSDIYGRRQFFIAAISIFIVGSLLCTFSTSMYMLAGFRAVQGVGAGGLFSLALAIVGDLVPPRERAKYQGYFLAVFGTASVFGPLIGGFLADADTILGVSGWRWVFLINVPVGLLALLVVWRNLHVDHHRVDHAIDWLGAVTLIVALVPNGAGRRAGRWPARRSERSGWWRSSSPNGAPVTRHCCRPGCSRTGRWAFRWCSVRSSEWACSAASSCCRCGCRSCTAPAPPSPAC